jgi:hypothetical protein
MTGSEREEYMASMASRRAENDRRKSEEGFNSRMSQAKESSEITAGIWRLT